MTTMQLRLWLLRAILVAGISFSTTVVSSEDDSDAAYIENMRRMGMYDTAFQERLTASNISMNTISAMDSVDHAGAAPPETPPGAPVEAASPQVLQALQTMIDASNLSRHQRAELIQYLQLEH
jgi:hypothetical protein